MRCELYCSDCSVLADCGILNDVIEFVVANEATISAMQHSSSAAPMQLYFIIMVLVSYGASVQYYGCYHVIIVMQ